ncbi:MAG: zinc ribbon domain-containing protein [Labilithrix sp.]|nr:zinc ribbon domain-containing protein [Labilithrix sp.]MCW5810398.1 zinc ribbon domain-containing protein [Labilithrix sp.]
MSEASQLDEAKIAKVVSLGLPAVTVVSAGIVGVMMGPATSILVLAAGLLLGVIAILWSSIRVLSGDAPLPPELEELDMHAHADALTSRKTMLLRALKDIENERALGKIEADDYEPIAAQYRSDLKAVMTKIDQALAPNRALAEEAAREHLLKAGVGGEPAPEPAPVAKKKAKDEEPARVECPSCNAKNEPDAKFCKECATKLEKVETTDA